MKATLYIPKSDNIPASRFDCLPDDQAIVCGRIAARTLSVNDGFVIVKLSDGTEKVMSYNEERDEVVIGTLRYNYRTNGKE